MEFSKSKVFIVAGPSGVGKNTIVSALLEHFEHAVSIPTYTTRPPREDDKLHNHRVSISEEEFLRMIENDELLEFKKVHKWYYGKRKIDFKLALTDNKHAILEIDVQGLDDYRKHFQNLCAIFIQYENLDQLKDRIRKNRKDATEKDLQIRLESAIKEMEHKHKYDHVITSVEGDIEKNLNEIIRIIEDKLEKNQ